MGLKREALPSFFLPLFSICVALCNIGVIILSIVFYTMNIEFAGLIELSAGVDSGIILGINILFSDSWGYYNHDPPLVELI